MSCLIDLSRASPLTRGPMPAQRKEQDTKATELKTAAALLLLDSHANSNATDVQFLALLLAQKSQSLSKAIPRGPYNAVKSNDFLIKLIHEFGDKAFKSFLR